MSQAAARLFGGACGQDQNQGGDDYIKSIGKADESR
jgi:hypothetical protein